MKINKNPTTHDVRRFALVWACAAAILGGLLFWRHHPLAARGAWAASATVALLGLAAPGAAKYFYRAWMALAAGINFVITRAVLLFIFWGVLTPLALLFRILKRDALQLKDERQSRTSYWEAHDKLSDLEYYRHLY